jgi:hypothetical protein
MKRLTVLGIIALAVVSTLLVAAGSGWDSDKGIDPHSYKNVPFAVVNTIWGNSKKVYFGELAYGSERYLMLVNSHADDQISSGTTETIYLAVNPGPGKYQVKAFRPFGDDLDTLIDTIFIYGTHRLDTVSFSLTRGGSILLHFDPITSDSSCSSISVSNDSATYWVNGRKIAVDKFGRIHICYNDKISNIFSVWYARSDDFGQSWQKQKVADSAICPAIAVDTFGVPWISYLAHPTLQKMLLWSEGFDTAAVVIDFTKNRGIDSITNAPAVALDFKQGLGVIYFSSKFVKRTDMRRFELPSVKVIDNKNTIVQTDYTISPMSCVVTPWGSGMATGLVTSQGQYNRNLSVRHDCNLISTKPSTEQQRIASRHGDPSLASIGNNVWAVYYVKESNDIRYKGCNSNVTFPSGTSGTSIASVPFGCHAQDVQIADGLPIIVWTNVNADSTRRKIYYTYMLRGVDNSWSTPTRVSNTDTTVIERFPHVDFDYDNKKVYVVWSQSSGGTKSVNIKTLTFSGLDWDSITLVKPNGDPLKPKPWELPEYMVGKEANVIWNLNTSNNPCSTRVYVNYNYPNGFFEYDTTQTSGSAKSIVWYPKTGTSSCRVKAEVWYPGAKNPYDISDNNFTVYDSIRVHPI